jgi:hypothetical protein
MGLDLSYLLRSALGGVAAYQGGQRQGRADQAKAATDAEDRQRKIRMDALEMALKERQVAAPQEWKPGSMQEYQTVHPQQPQAPRNIDPLSAEGIKARTALERATRHPAAEKAATMQTWQREGYPSFEAWRQDKLRTGTSAMAGLPSDPERMAAGYYDRMANDEQAITDNADTGRPTGVTETAGAMPLVGNYLRRKVSSPAQQQYRQAQEDWVRAKLRKESGAAISVSEMQGEIETYFPQPGDGPAVIAQKKRARQVAQQAMHRNAGRAAPAGPTDTEPTVSPQERTQTERAHDDLLAKYGLTRALIEGCRLR